MNNPVLLGSFGACLVPCEPQFANSLASAVSNPGPYRLIKITLLSIMNLNIKYANVFKFLKANIQRKLEHPLLNFFQPNFCSLSITTQFRHI
jgi:hypothetical protein